MQIADVLRNKSDAQIAGCLILTGKNMKEYLKLLLKVFVAETIVFGILVGIFLLIQDFPMSTALINGLLMGSAFGLVMSFIGSSLHFRAVKKTVPKVSEEALSVKQTRRIYLGVPYEEAFDLCLDSLQVINRCKIQQEERPQGKIVAWTEKSWGQKDIITFDLSKDYGDRVQIVVSSKPSLSTTLIDFGRNLRHIEAIVSQLEREKAPASQIANSQF
jgi:hypothetical protein